MSDKEKLAMCVAALAGVLKAREAHQWRLNSDEPPAWADAEAALKQAKAKHRRTKREKWFLDNVPHLSDGNLECDDDAVVSEGEDDGAYVQTWKWVEANETTPKKL